VLQLDADLIDNDDRYACKILFAKKTLFKARRERDEEASQKYRAWEELPDFKDPN
jgi:hypothetical protein